MMRDLKRALPFIAGALAHTFGVKVLRGDRACTDAKNTIWLPPLPDNDPKAEVKALGFIGHEAAHIIESDFDVLKEIKSPGEKGILNTLEDMRIDKRQMIRYPGFGDIRGRMMQNLVEDDELFIPDENCHPFQILDRFIHYTLRCEYLGQTQLEPVREKTEKVFRSFFPKGFQIRIEALMFEVAKTKSTRDVLELTRAIIKMVQEEAEKEKEKEEQQEQLNQQKQEQQKQEQQQSDNGASDQSQQSDSTGQDGGQDQADDGGQDASSGTDGQGDIQQGSKASEKLQQVLAAGDSDVPEEFGQMLARQLGNISNATPRNRVTEVFNAQIQPSHGMDSSYDAQSRANVNAITHALHSMVEEQTMTSRRHTEIGLRMNPGKLHLAHLNPKVYVRKSRQLDPDAAVTLLVDRSGSTIKIIEGLGMVAYSVSSALSVIDGVETAVAAFPMPHVQYLHTFGDIPQASARNFSILSSGGGTPMAQAINRVSMDLLMQDKAKHLLFIVTDGGPDDSEACRVSIQMAEGAGIEVYGVGIGVNLSHLFQNWISIADLGELPTKLFGMVQNSLLEQAA
jgi:hypothetical protein